MPKIIPYSYIQNYFKAQGCTLLSKTYRTSKLPLRYRCKCGKIRTTCFNNFSRGYRCMLCHMNRFNVSRKRKLQKLQLRNKLYTVSDVARMLNVSSEELHNAIHIKQTLPGPTRKLGVTPRLYYNEADIRKLMKLVQY